MAKKKTTTKKRAPAAAEAETSERVDAIRNILFGAKMQDYDRRFSQLEQKLESEVGRAGDEFARRLEVLEKFAKRELDKLGGQFKTERTERKANLRSNEKALQSLQDHAESQFEEVERRLNEEADELRQSLHDRSKELLDTIKQEIDGLRQFTAEQLDVLAADKVSREELAGYFSEMALRLKGEFELPDEG